jgi:hypothetical protein
MAPQDPRAPCWARGLSTLRDISTKEASTLAREKRDLDAKERALIGALSQVLPSIGYRLVPAPKGLAHAAGRADDHAEPAPAGRWLPARSAAAASCAPPHLGRHMSVAHGRRRAGRGRGRRRAV